MEPCNRDHLSTESEEDENHLLEENLRPLDTLRSHRNAVRTSQQGSGAQKTKMDEQSSLYENANNVSVFRTSSTSAFRKFRKPTQKKPKTSNYERKNNPEHIRSDFLLNGSNGDKIDTNFRPLDFPPCYGDTQQKISQSTRDESDLVAKKGDLPEPLTPPRLHAECYQEFSTPSPPPSLLKGVSLLRSPQCSELLTNHLGLELGRETLPSQNAREAEVSSQPAPKSYPDHDDVSLPFLHFRTTSFPEEFDSNSSLFRAASLLRRRAQHFQLSADLTTTSDFPRHCRSHPTELNQSEHHSPPTFLPAEKTVIKRMMQINNHSPFQTQCASVLEKANCNPVQTETLFVDDGKSAKCEFVPK